MLLALLSWAAQQGRAEAFATGRLEGAQTTKVQQPPPPPPFARDPLPSSRQGESPLLGHTALAAIARHCTAGDPEDHKQVAVISDTEHLSSSTLAS